MATFKEYNRQVKIRKTQTVTRICNTEMSIQSEAVFFILGRADEANVVKSAAKAGEHGFRPVIITNKHLVLVG